MPFDVAATGRLVFARPYQDPEGQIVRDRLGDGANCVVHAALIDEKIEADRQRAAGVDIAAITLPPRPFIALRRNAIPTVERVLYLALFTWWIYDDPDQLYWNIDSLCGLLVRSYAAKKLDQHTGGVIGNVHVGDFGPQLPDISLGLLSSSVQVAILAG